MAMLAVPAAEAQGVQADLVQGMLTRLYNYWLTFQADRLLS